MTVLTLSGSPSASSRSSRLLTFLRPRLQALGHAVIHLELRNLPPGALLAGDREDPDIAAALDQVAAADALVLATPVYQAAYSGLLKTFLDVLPQTGLRGKTVLPIASGGSLAHMLAIDYALRPVLSALSARHVLHGVYAQDHQVQGSGAMPLLDAELAVRLEQGVSVLADIIGVVSERYERVVPLQSGLPRAGAMAVSADGQDDVIPDADSEPEPSRLILPGSV